jgi:hypothetical protein
VSYSVVGAIVNGLMGINVEPAAPLEALAKGQRFAIVVQTLPQLSAPTAWAEVRNLPVGAGMIDVRHDGNRATVLSNHGDERLEWEAVFPGQFTTLVINGKPQPAQEETLPLGRTVTRIRVQVKAGRRIRVAVPN